MSDRRDQRAFDVVGIGNAIVDVISHESEAFLQEFKLIKESMALVDEKTAMDLYNSMSPTIQTSGGSAANTMSGIASPMIFTLLESIIP